MARKSAAVLKSIPVVLPRLAKKFIQSIEKSEVPEGTDEQFQRYLKASIAHEEQRVRVDMLCEKVDKKGSNDPDWPAYQAALKDYDRTYVASTGALDAWLFTIKHINDDILVPEEDLRAVAKDSLGAKIGDLQFSVNFGILGSKIAQVIREFAIETEMGEIPLCQDCS